MRASAEVLPAALLVDGDLFQFRQVPDDLGLVDLADGLEMRDRFGPVPDLAFDGQVLIDDFRHPLFDGLEIIRRERLVAGKVVVEAVFDGRADGHLGAGKQFLDRLGQHMGGIVAQQLQRILVPGGDDGEIAVTRNFPVEVPHFAVDPRGQRRLGEAGADVGGHRGAGHRRPVVPDAAVGQRQLHVRACFCSVRHRSVPSPSLKDIAPKNPPCDCEEGCESVHIHAPDVTAPRGGSWRW